MADDVRFPPIEPYETGTLDVGDGHRMYWECSGNPDGKPVVLLHGGPGSGTSPSWRRWHDPQAYRIVCFDQRGCGRSTPDAADHKTDLSVITLVTMVEDIELLRRHLDVESWQVVGASWGSVLGLAYAQRHPERVTELILFAVASSNRRHVRWMTRDLGRIFPEAWQRFAEGVPRDERDGDLSAAYARLLEDPDPAVREQAALAWCAWEDTHVSLHPAHAPDPRFDDPVFRMRFARQVTHNWSHASWLRDDELIDGATALSGIPGVLVAGRLDVSGPVDTAWRLHRAWPGSELVIDETGGHGFGDATATAVVAATDRFRTRHP